MSYRIIELASNDRDWRLLILQGLDIADRIEFNVLYLFPGRELKTLLNDLEGEIVSPEPDTRFYFDHKRRVSIPVNPKSKRFILSRNFEEWGGYIFEDPCLVVEGHEILGSITHERTCRIDTEAISFPPYDATDPVP